MKDATLGRRGGPGPRGLPDQSSRLIAMGADPRSARQYLAGQRWALQSRWAGHPSYLAYSRRRHPLAVLRAETELVIEAYPRSANTFSAVALQISQPPPVR